MESWKLNGTEGEPPASIEDAGDDLFVVVNGLRIARRGRPGTKEAKTWISILPGWTVHQEGGLNGDLIVTHNGVGLH
jgi:hypothetical protein